MASTDLDNTNPVQTDESGMVVGRPLSFPTGNADSAANYGPDVLGGRTFDAPPSGPISAAAAKSAPTPVTTNISGDVRQANSPGLNPQGSADSQAATLGISRDGINPPNAPSTPAAPPGGWGMDPSVVRSGNSFSGAGTAQPDGIDAANRAARAEMSVMNARAADAQDKQNALSHLGNLSAQAAFDARNKAQADYVDQKSNQNRTEWMLNDKPRALAAYETSLAAGRPGQGVVSSAAQGLPMEGMVNGAKSSYVQDALAQNEAGSKAVQQAMELRKSQQGLAAGDQSLKKGGVDLANAQHFSQLHTALSTEQDPAKRQAIAEQILIASGHQPSPRYEVHPLGGGQVTNEMGQNVTQPQSFGIVDKQAGTFKRIGPDGKPVGEDSKPSRDDAVAQAKAAIAKGADKNAINARLQSMGYGAL